MPGQAGLGARRKRGAHPPQNAMPAWPEFLLFLCLLQELLETRREACSFLWMVPGMELNVSSPCKTLLCAKGETTHHHTLRSVFSCVAGMLLGRTAESEDRMFPCLLTRCKKPLLKAFPDDQKLNLQHGLALASSLCHVVNSHPSPTHHWSSQSCAARRKAEVGRARSGSPTGTSS